MDLLSLACPTITGLVVDRVGLNKLKDASSFLFYVSTKIKSF
jgi:hypothetical protein